MRSTERTKRFGQRNMLSTADVGALFPEEPPAVEVTGQIVEFPIADLVLDDQPRQIVPDATLARLIAEDAARPPRLLAELRSIAESHPYYRSVLEALGALAKTIAADGVLEPLLVVKTVTGDGAVERFVLRDGHRRSLASLIAGRETVPIRATDEPSAVQAATRQLVVNIQRQDLTALEKGRWLYRLARLVEEGLRAEDGLPAGQSVVEALVQDGDRPVIHVDSGPAADGDGNGASDRSVTHVDKGRAATPEARALAAAVRQRVLELTGLGQAHYYRLLYLNRLTPEAQEAGLGMSEGQLRPVTSLPPADQAEIVRFISARRLTSKEAASLVQVARSGDRDAVRRVMAKLAKDDVGRSRAAVSWEGLLHALPKDLWVRCSSLKAELAALAPERREVRLRAMWEQRRLAEELRRQFDEVFDLYGFGGPAASAEPHEAAE